MGEPQTTDRLPSGTTSAALIMVLGALPTMLDSTIVNVAINGLSQNFGTDLAVMQWAVTGYVLALAVAVPFSGWLIQRYDGKRLYMAALGLFMVGSLLSGLAWSAPSLIAFRLVQGFSAGILMPLLSTLAVQMAGGSNNLGKLMSLVGIPAVFAPIIGPVVGGLIMQYLPWNWLFLVNLPLGAIGLIGLQLKLPNYPASQAGARLDWPGIILLAAASAALIYGVTKVVKAGDHTIGLVSLVFGGLAFLGYIAYAVIRPTKAIIGLDLFKTRNFSAAFAALFLAGFATNGPMLLFPMLFQNVRHLSVIESALWLLPQGIGMLIARPQVGKLTDRIGARFVVLPAIGLTLIGTVPFMFFTASTSPWLVWIVLLVRGAGVGGFTVPLMADSFIGLSPAKVPSASVATRIIQNVGSAFGSAVLATVVTSVLAKTSASLTGAYQAGFGASVAFMVVSVLPALFLTRKATSRPGEAKTAGTNPVSVAVR